MLQQMVTKVVKKNNTQGAGKLHQQCTCKQKNLFFMYKKIVFEVKLAVGLLN